MLAGRGFDLDGFAYRGGNRDPFTVDLHKGVLRHVFQHNHPVLGLNLEDPGRPSDDEPQEQDPGGHSRPHPPRPLTLRRRDGRHRNIGAFRLLELNQALPRGLRTGLLLKCLARRHGDRRSARHGLWRHGTRAGRCLLRIGSPRLGELRLRSRGRDVPLLEERRQRLRHLAGGLEPPARLLRHHLGHHGGQLDRDLGADEVKRTRVHREVGLVKVPEVLAAERRPAGQEVIESTAEAVDVGPDVGRLGVADLLGGDEVGRAQHLALAGQAAVGLAFAGHLGQAEVEHLDDALLALESEDQVGRLDVAVDHAPLVGVLQAQRRLVDEVAGVDHRERAAGLHHLRQVFPVDVLHGKDDALAEPRWPSTP